jgi:hypothetical protein
MDRSRSAVAHGGVMGPGLGFNLLVKVTASCSIFWNWTRRTSALSSLQVSVQDATSPTTREASVLATSSAPAFAAADAPWIFFMALAIAAEQFATHLWKSGVEPGQLAREHGGGHGPGLRGGVERHGHQRLRVHLPRGAHDGGGPVRHRRDGRLDVQQALPQHAHAALRVRRGLARLHDRARARRRARGVEG